MSINVKRENENVIIGHQTFYRQFSYDFQRDPTYRAQYYKKYYTALVFHDLTFQANKVNL